VSGAQSSLLTLWDVNDRSTARFVTSFYRHLAASASKAEALARAMEEVCAEFPHPTSGLHSSWLAVRIADQ
jgi:CHAT domain-containing protein